MVDRIFANLSHCIICQFESNWASCCLPSQRCRPDRIRFGYCASSRHSNRACEEHGLGVCCLVNALGFMTIRMELVYRRWRNCGLKLPSKLTKARFSDRSPDFEVSGHTKISAIRRSSEVFHNIMLINFTTGKFQRDHQLKSDFLQIWHCFTRDSYKDQVVGFI
jgi:hypothetical protein